MPVYTYTTLDDPLGTRGTGAQGINDAGQIVGLYVDASNHVHGFLYSGGSYTTLDDPLATGVTGALGINAAGQIVGTYDDATGTHGFLFDPNSGIFPPYFTLNDPSANAGTTRAVGINAADQIVGSYMNASGIHGFLLSGGTYTRLDDPLATGQKVGECDSNRVVVGMAIVLGLAMTAIIERQHKSRIVRIGCQRRRQEMKVGCGAGETG